MGELRSPHKFSTQKQCTTLFFRRDSYPIQVYKEPLNLSEWPTHHKCREFDILKLNSIEIYIWTKTPFRILLDITLYAVGVERGNHLARNRFSGHSLGQCDSSLLKYFPLPPVLHKRLVLFSTSLYFRVITPSNNMPKNWERVCSTSPVETVGPEQLTP